mgnify:CR=1 FL=1
MNKLENIFRVREQFNPKNKNHMAMTRDFFRDYRWGDHGCPFILEWPYLTVTEMIRSKLIDTHIGSIIENAG